jgi:iron complex transport system ATP-binding protein
MISMEKVYSGYGKKDILKDISLDFRKGEMVAVLGPNGSGKTTLVSTISGILYPSLGMVKILNKSAREYSRKDLARIMAVIPQRVELSFDITVRDMVLMGRYAYTGWFSGYGNEDYSKCFEAMEKTSVSHLADRSIKVLSGGEFQRVLIARAVAQATSMMILDEAASGIDVSGKIEIFNLLRLLASGGTGIISVIHDLNLASVYFDRLIFFKNGQVVLDGKPSEVITEENIAYVYDADVRIVQHPELGLPQVLFNPATVDTVCRNSKCRNKDS